MPRPALVPRLQPFTSTIFAEMTALAVRAGAVNLGQGFPDFDGPAALLDDRPRRDRERAPTSTRRAPARRSCVPRSPSTGRSYGTAYDPDTEVLVTVGATEAIAACLLALVEQGDEVVLVEPYYDSYAAAVAMAGASRRGGVAGRGPGRPAGSAWTSTPCARRSRRGPRRILINSPHNPTGTVFTREELDAVAELCVEHDLIAISDEVYEHLTYDGTEHVPLARCPAWPAAR